MKAICILLVMLWALNCFSQNFEGKMILKNTFRSKMPNVTSEQLTTMFGSTQDYYIKDGEYKSVTNGTLVQWQLYVNADNKLYNKFSNSDTLTWYDGASNSDEVLKSEIHKAATEILGYTCDELILTCKSGVQKYYFNSSFGVDSNLYVNHKFGNWYAYLALTNALPLKSVADNQQFVVEMLVTEVIPMKLDKAFFELPVDVATKQSTF